IVSGAIALAVDPVQPNHLLLATDSGLLRSRNAGLDWSLEAPSVLVGAVFAVAFDDDGRRALASTGASLFRNDGGDTWHAVTAPRAPRTRRARGHAARSPPRRGRRRRLVSRRLATVLCRRRWGTVVDGDRVAAGRSAGQPHRRRARLRHGVRRRRQPPVGDG